MSPSAKLVYLHGIGGHDKLGTWLPTLNDALAHREGPYFSTDDVLAPRYRDLLRGQGVEEEPPRPESTSEKISDPGPLRLNQNTLQRRLAELTGKRTSPLSRVPTALREQALKWSGFETVRRYIDDEAVRLSIWNRVLAEVQGERSLILIGHSLGSVVAVDVMPFIPSDTEVLALVTVGSPLGAVEPLRARSRPMQSEDEFPFDRLRSWVNLFDPADFVTGGKGVSKWYRDALDVPVRNSPSRAGPRAHEMPAYAGHAALADTITFACRNLPRQQSHHHKERPPMDRIWQPLLLAFTYTQKLHAVIPEDEPKRRGRISRAREELASRVTAQIRDLPHEAQEGAPDFEELTRHPHRRIAGEISDLDLAAMLAALMGTWPLAPFEREIDRKRATEALLDVCDRVRDPSLETSAISDRGFADGADQARRIARRAIDVDAKYPEPMWTQNLANETFRDLALSGASPFHDHAPAVIDAAFGPAGMTAGMHYALALRPVALGNEVGGRSHEPQESTVHRLRVTNQIISQTCLSMGRTPTRTLLMSLMASIALQDRLLPDLDQTPTRQTLVSVAEALTREYEIHSEIAPDADKTHDIRKKLRAAEAALRCFTQIPEEVDERAPRWRFQPPR